MTFAATAEASMTGFDRRKTPDSRKIWTQTEATALYEMPLNDLRFKAQTVHRQSFDPNWVQRSRLLSIKTGGCPEDCGYCSQSQHYDLGLTASKLMEVERVVAEARKARDAGATRSFADRLLTLENVRAAGMKVCCGGIVGMGEQASDRIEMLTILANLPEHPESVPINMLIPIAGTPLANATPIEPIDFVRTIALARRCASRRAAPP